MAKLQIRVPALPVAESANQSFVLDIDEAFPGSGITVIYGHSGSGKTSLLRCLAGLLRLPGSEIRLGENVWQDNEVYLATHKRSVGYVFQESSLFMHLTVRGNLQFALKRAAKSKSGIDTQSVIDIMGIDPLLDRTPAQLSGGERQRVAIARAVLSNPALLLMDEPLASLGVQHKNEILSFLETLRGILKIPIVYVTHSLDEAARLADYLVVLENGRVQVAGKSSAVLADIESPMQQDAQAGAVIKAQVAEIDSEWNLQRLVFDGGELQVPATSDEVGREVRLRILARDVSVALDGSGQSSILNRLPVILTALAQDSDAAMLLVQLRAGKTEFVARLTRKSAAELGLQENMRVWAQIKSVAILR